MVVAHDRLSDLLFGAAVVVALASCHPEAGSVMPPMGRERADALVAAYAAHAGAPDRTLDPSGDVTFGTTGLHYSLKDDVLYGRVYVNMARTKGAPPERLAAYARMSEALNDPHVGGMYDRASGYFVLDKEREAFFLVRPYQVARTTPENLIAGMEQAQDVAARWTTSWFYQVAMIMHGHRKPPERPVTLESAE